MHLEIRFEYESTPAFSNFPAKQYLGKHFVWRGGPQASRRRLLEGPASAIESDSVEQRLRALLYMSEG